MSMLITVKQAVKHSNIRKQTSVKKTLSFSLTRRQNLLIISTYNYVVCVFASICMYVYRAGRCAAGTRGIQPLPEEHHVHRGPQG